MEALTNRLTTRVWLNDIDVNLHMNNGRYMTVCDLNRVDLFIRTGLLALMLKQRWSPIVSQHTMDYKKGAATLSTLSGQHDYYSLGRTLFLCGTYF